MKKKFILAHMRAADVYAGLSYDKRLNVGAMLVKNNRPITVGYNGTPAGEDNACQDANGVTKPNVIHAEINALKGLARINETGAGSILFCTHSPCPFCATEIFDAGIQAVFFKHKYRLDDGIKKLLEKNVAVYQVDYDKNTGMNGIEIYRIELADGELRKCLAQTYDNNLPIPLRADILNPLVS